MHAGRNSNTILVCLLAAISLIAGCLQEEEPAEESAAQQAPPAPSSAGNTAPTISGTPKGAVSAGYHYSFVPTAVDPDNDSLTFDVQNLPAWATFNISTGEIFGTTSQDDVGIYSNIVISVSDGVETVTLPEFSINVSNAAAGSMAVSWTPPTKNTDGSDLTDLAGYRLYIGTSRGTYTNRIDVNSAGVVSYVVDNLEPDTYYVVATSYNSTGLESAFSNVAEKTVL